jgi:hypothetical protein
MAVEQKESQAMISWLEKNYPGYSFDLDRAVFTSPSGQISKPDVGAINEALSRQFPNAHITLTYGGSLAAKQANA